jgi:hypothetical protein
MVWSKTGQIVHETLSQKTLHKNRAGRVAQDEWPEFKPQYCPKRLFSVEKHFPGPQEAPYNVFKSGGDCESLLFLGMLICSTDWDLLSYPSYIFRQCCIPFRKEVGTAVCFILLCFLLCFTMQIKFNKCDLLGSAWMHSQNIQSVTKWLLWTYWSKIVFTLI